MQCADEDTLAALISGDLPETERLAVANHAATCVTCHALIDGLLPPSENVDDTPAKLKPGERVGRYEIEGRLGAGGMGIVYAATDTELHRKVAIKLLRPDGVGRIGTQGRERLMREARLLAALSHPNVVTVFDVGTHDGHVFVAMELVDGGNLPAWLARSPRSTNDIVDRMIEAGRGLAAAHARGVVHRDVKPDNILVGLDGRARVTDFGLARIGDDVEESARPSAILSPDLTATGTLMGTPVYMAPEQWRSGRAEPRTDQWAFCATLYELVAGVRPFPVDDPAKRLAAIEAGTLATPRPERSVPGWIRKIIARGVRASPEERWASMDVVVDALERGRRRRRRIVVSASVILALAIVGTSVGIAITRQRPVAKQPIVAPIGMAADDMRPGCSCPFSMCEEGACSSVCKATDFDYTHLRHIPSLNVVGEQEALVGLTLDGDTILYLGGKYCNLDRLKVAHRSGDDFVSTDLTDQLDLERLELVEGCCAMAPDGRSVIVRRRDHLGFDRIALDGTKLGAIDREELANLRPQATPAITVGFPALSNDGLRAYVMVFDASEGAGENGPQTGAFLSTRTDTTQPFGPSKRITGPIRSYSHVTAESADGLTVFSDTEYGTAVLARNQLSERFDNPLPNNNPPRIVGLRTYPVGDCSRVITTYTPGGCRQEEMVWLDGVRRAPKVPRSSPK